MRYTDFSIFNFRGIDKAHLNLASKPNSNIHCIVGLNESGKTTVLEAINYFTYNSEELDALELKGYLIDDPNSLIPIAKRSNFSGPISIKVGLSLDAQDEDYIKKEVKRLYDYEIVGDFEKISITQKLNFENSKHKNNSILWGIRIFGKLVGKKGKNAELLNSKNEDLWLKIVGVVKERIPEVLYFPNFLFDFPERIILEENMDDGDEKHQFYAAIFQDILNSLNNGLSIKTHVVDRAKSKDSSDKVSLNQLLLDAGRELSKTIFSQWDNIFKSKRNHKRIVLTCGVDEAEKCYVEFKIEENGSIYNVTERSLGFRWFFVFFLLTYYRARRVSAKSGVLFLFDEPASNLHQSAQTQLLKTFDDIGHRSQIIYTTHSHHLINPNWLDSTFIVRNEGLHSPDEISEYDASKTKVLVFPYRSFVNEYPDQTAYFQPILDILDYCPSDFELVDNVVMTEGKGDFYWMKYFLEVISKKKYKFKILPGTGSGSLETVIRLYLAWGKNFIVLLDDDEAGKKEMLRYLDIFGSILHGKVMTYKNIDDKFEKYEVENLLSRSELLGIQCVCYPGDTKFNKTHSTRAIQELLAKKQLTTLSTASLQNIDLVLDHCEQYFAKKC